MAQQLVLHPDVNGTSSLYYLLGDPNAGVFDSRPSNFIASGATLSSPVALTDLTISVSSATPFNLNTTIHIDSEYLFITNIAGTTLTVTRGYDASTVATHSSGATININQVVAIFNSGKTFRVLDSTLQYDVPVQLVGGTIDNVVIGGTTPAVGTFTVLKANTTLSTGIVSPLLTWHLAGGQMVIEPNSIGLTATQLGFSGYSYGGLVVGSVGTSQYTSLSVGGALRTTGNPLGFIGFHSFNTNNNLATTVGAEIVGQSEDSVSTNYGMELVFFTRTGTGTLTEAMRIHGSGKTKFSNQVGVFTDPSAPLHVIYAAANSSVTTPVAIFDNPSGGANALIGFAANGVVGSSIRWDTVRNLVLNVGTSGTLYLAFTDLAAAGIVDFQAGKAQVTAGVLTTYNGQVTVGNGVPSDIVREALTGQAAAITTTSTGYTPPVAGDYLVSIVLEVTTAGTSGTITASAGFTDDVGLMAVSVTSAAVSSTGRVNGVFAIHAKTTTALTYTVAFNSIVGNPVYSVFINILRLS